ncbi:MAG: hypothetical protein U0736_22290 [Gemmataceae bacterium]
MRRIALSTLLLISAVAPAQIVPGKPIVQTPAPPLVGTPAPAVVAPAAPPAPVVAGAAVPVLGDHSYIVGDGVAPMLGDGGRAPFESDHAFPNFIGPISSPVLSKDPRSLTEARALFIQNWLPKDHALGGGEFQAYGMQARVALTDRLTFIADKDGIVHLKTGSGPAQTGLLDVAAGLKYTILRDVENQRLGAVGFMYEMPSGEANVYQNHGAGVWTVFGVYGQEFGCWHVLFNESFQFGQNARDNVSFFFTQLHVDRQLFGWLYPVAEVNWFQYVSSGNRGIPAAVGEGGSLINLGTSGMSGKSLCTGALGLKARINRHLDAGAVWETPLSSRKDLIGHRVVAELIFRY